VAEGNPNPQDKMAELEESVRRLETKLAELGVSKEAPVSKPGAEAQSVPEEEALEERHEDQAGGNHDLALERPLAASAVLCVVLVCALLLRRSAEASWVSPTNAPIVGIAYCTLLLGLGAALFPRVRMVGALLAHSALVLGFLIVLETHFGRGTLSLGRAQATLAGFAIASAALGWARRAPAVGFVGIVFGAYLAVFIGPHRMVFADVAWGLGLAEVLALVLAYRLDWMWLRWPLFVLAQLFALTWAIYLRVKGLDDPRLAGFTLGVVAVEIPFVAASAWQTIRGTRRLDAIESSGPLGGTATPLALFAFARVPARVGLASALAVALLGFGGWRATQRTKHTAGGAFLLAGGLIAVWWWPLLAAPVVVSGVALALLGVGMFAVGRRIDPSLASARSPTAVGHAMQGVLVGRLISLGAIYQAPSPTSTTSGETSITLAVVVASIAIAQYVAARVVWPPRARPPRPSEPDRESIVAAIAGAVALFGAIRVACALVLHASTGPAFQMCQSVAACALIAGALGAAMWFRIDDLLELAVVALVVLGAKIVFYDTFTLPLTMAIPAVASLAAALGLASLAIQRRRKKA